jgi:hypothetical protein
MKNDDPIQRSRTLIEDTIKIEAPYKKPSQKKKEPKKKLFSDYDASDERDFLNFFSFKNIDASAYKDLIIITSLSIVAIGFILLLFWVKLGFFIID